MVSGGKVYTLGAEGNLLCLDAESGKVLWSRDFKKDFGIKAPMWGFAGHPLLDGNRLICLAGGAGSTAVAFDKDTGKEIWRALSAEEPGYSSPMIYEAGGKRQLILWHPEAANSLESGDGEVYWSVPFKLKAGMTLATPRKLGDWLFFTSLLQRLADAAARFRPSPPRPRLAHAEGEREGHDPPQRRHVHAVPGGRLYLRRLQLRPVAVPEDWRRASASGRRFRPRPPADPSAGPTPSS